MSTARYSRREFLALTSGIAAGALVPRLSIAHTGHNPYGPAGIDG